MISMHLKKFCIADFESSRGSRLQMVLKMVHMSFLFIYETQLLIGKTYNPYLVWNQDWYALYHQSFIYHSTLYHPT